MKNALLPTRSKFFAIASFVLLGTLLAAARPAFAQPKRDYELPPRDEMSRDRTLAQLRTELLSIIDKKDAQALKRYLHPTLRIGFGQEQDEDGRALLVERLSPQSPESGKLWDALRKLLVLGGTFLTQGEFCAPYVYTLFPPALDAFEYVAVIVHPAQLRTKPSDQAPVAAKLHYDILRRSPGAFDPSAKWVRVERLLDKRAGYIKASEIRSSIDYRACFEKTGGRWQMTSFVAGD